MVAATGLSSRTDDLPGAVMDLGGEGRLRAGVALRPSAGGWTVAAAGVVLRVFTDALRAVFFRVVEVRDVWDERVVFFAMILFLRVLFCVCVSGALSDALSGALSGSLPSRRVLRGSAGAAAHG